MSKESKQKIRDMYDSNLDMTLAELSKITGQSIKSLKRILMS